MVGLTREAGSCYVHNIDHGEWFLEQFLQGICGVMTTLRVGRSPMRMWLIALAGVPFVVMAADFMARRRILNWFVQLIYGERTPDAFEARDTLWAVVFLVVGATFIVLGLKELIFPRPVLVADEETTRWALRGPFRALVEIPWDSILSWTPGEH